MKILVRLLRVIIFPVALGLVITGIATWILTGRNIGFELVEWSITGEIEK